MTFSLSISRQDDHAVDLILEYKEIRGGVNVFSTVIVIFEIYHVQLTIFSHFDIEFRFI